MSAWQFIAIYAAGIVSSALCAYWWALRSWREGYKACEDDCQRRRRQESASHSAGGTRRSRARYHRFE